MSAYSWTGCYIGAQVGGGFMKDSENGNSSDNIFHAGGAIAGGQAGCNYQIRQFVFGLEGEGWWSGISDPSTSSNTEITDGVVTDSYSDQSLVKNRWDAAFSLRAGWAFDRVLLYMKAGGAWGGFTISQQDTSSSSNYFDTQTSTGSKVLPGMLLGWGIEYAFLDNWTARIEADYINFANTSFPFSSTETCTGTSCSYTTQTNTGTNTAWAAKAILKAGVSYKF